MLVASVIPPTPLPCAKALAAARIATADIRIFFFVIANLFIWRGEGGISPPHTADLNNCFSFSLIFLVVVGA